MARVVWSTKHVAGVGQWLGRMLLYMKRVNKALQKDEKQAFCSHLNIAAWGLVLLEQWVTSASLHFLPSWQEASSWEWPCGSGMTHRRQISSTCIWARSRPPTPSTSVSRCGHAGSAAWISCPRGSCSVPKSRAESSR